MFCSTSHMEDKTIRHKKLIFTFFCTIISVFLSSLSEELLGLDTLSSYLSYVDELFVLGLCIYVSLSGKMNRTANRLLGLICIFFIIGIVSSYLYKGIGIVSFLGGFNTIKPLLLFWALSVLTFGKGDIDYLFKLFSILFPIIIFFEFLDIIYPTFRSSIGFKLQVSEERMGLRSIGGIMPRFTMTTIMGITYFYIYSFYRKSKPRALLSIPLILLALRIKDIFAFVVASILTFNKRIKLKNLLIALAAFFLMFLCYMIYFPEHYARYFSDDDGLQARTALNLTSVEISKDYFPLGVGFGKFGSPTSQQIESDVYWRYGIDTVYGLNYKYNSNFMSDTFWPMILGETGVLGLFVYVIILFVIFTPFVRIYIKNTTDMRACIVVSLLVFNVICSIAKPTLTGPPNSLILFGFAGLFYSMLKLKSNE